MSSSTRRRAVAPDNAGDDEETLTRSTPTPVSWHEPPAAIASVRRHQGGCWDTLQWFTYYYWLWKCVTHKHLNDSVHTHLLDKLLPGTEGRGLMCTEQMYETGGKKWRKRQRACVIPDSWENTHGCLNLPSSLKHNGEITCKLPGRQQDVSRQSAPGSLPRELIRLEAHPGTLSSAFECTRFSTLIHPKPLQLM